MSFDMFPASKSLKPCQIGVRNDFRQTSCIYIVPVAQNDNKDILPNVLENKTRSQNSAYTTRKSLIFRVLDLRFIWTNPIWYE